jgi:biotin transport system substrate-specific component
MTNSLRQPLINQLIPVRRGALRVGLQLALGICFLALLAQFDIRIGPVPITGQTLGVLLLGAAYGMTLGAFTMGGYLLLGGLGLGVFTGGASGWAYFSGPTAGYLLGFVLAAAVVGYLAQRGWDRKASSTMLAMLLGQALIYLCGLLWLSHFAPAGRSAWGWTLAVGLAPFLLGDAVKLLLAAGLLPAAWAFLGKARG